MKGMKWIGVGSALLLIAACFMEWVFIRSKNISVSGVEATGTSFGKPGYLHFFLTAFFLVFTLVGRVWAKRANLLIAALNVAWSLRNYFSISACMGGECPEKHIGIYLVLITSIIMLISSFFPDMTLKSYENQ